MVKRLILKHEDINRHMTVLWPLLQPSKYQERTKDVVIIFKEGEHLFSAISRLAVKTFGKSAYFAIDKFHDSWDSQDGGMIFGQFLKGQNCITKQIGVEYEVRT